MYPSGLWDGFWQQSGWGRQPMREFQLKFHFFDMTGQGVDVIGPFTIRGSVDPNNGRVSFRKQYVGAHAVDYVGQPDGEGSILGTWTIRGAYEVAYEGSFLIKPVVKHKPDDVIHEIRPKS